MIENRIIHIKTNRLYFVDEVFNDVVFTLDNKCLPIGEIRNLTTKEKQTELIKHICNNTWDDETIKKTTDRIKGYSNDSNGITSWLRKVVSYLPKLGRGVRN